MNHAIKATAHENKIRRVAYFYSAAERRSRGALWPSFAPALIRNSSAHAPHLGATEFHWFRHDLLQKNIIPNVETRCPMTLCSACGAQLLPGAPNCPHCLLPVTAFAVPAPVRQPKPMFSALSLIGIAFVAVIALGAWLDKVRPQNSLYHPVTVTDTPTEDAATSSPAAFRKQCGDPALVRAGIEPADARGMGEIPSSAAFTYIYRTPPTEMHVIFLKDQEVPMVFREHLHGRVYAFSPHSGMVEMGCRLDSGAR